jgi:iron complex outermembrane receptor protein
MRIKLVYLLLLIGYVSTTRAQEPGRLSGNVTDGQSKPLQGASVHLLNTGVGMATDDKGNFTFNNLRYGTYFVQISAIGYATINREIYLMHPSLSRIVTSRDVTSLKVNESLNIKMVDASAQLDGVVVTAQKREEFLQQVPVSITAISSRQVQQYRLWNSRDLTAIVPNLYSTNSGDDRNVTSIRGITTTSYDPAVATYIDGVNQFNLDTYIAQLSDIERIEVLRGPQGTLYGRNAMGGVINIITKQPTNKSNGFAEANVGNYGLQRYSLGFRTPLIKNKLFLGASGLYNQRKGYYTNDFNNTSFDRQHSFTGNYYLRLVANQRLSFNLNIKHHNNRNNGAFPMVNSPDEALTNPFHLNQDATALMIDNTFNASLTANYTGTRFTFNSQTAYQSNHRYYNAPLDGDFSPIDGVSIINDYGNDWNNVKAWTQEFKLTAPATAGNKWTLGSYLFYQDNPTKQAVHFGADALLVGAPDTDFSLINSTKGKSYGIAFYGQTILPLYSNLDLIAGLRYDYEKKKYNVLGEYQKDPDPNPQFETRPDTSASVNFSSFSPKLGLSYKLSKQGNIFLTYSRGYRTGGLTQLSSDPSQPPLYPYKPEYSNNIEAGIKNNLLNNRLRLNIALFLTQVNDAQVPTLILPDAITITRNAGKLRSKGVELELAATPVKGLQVDYNFGYTDAVYKELKLSQNGTSVDLGGKKQIFTPDITSMLAGQYSFSIGTPWQLKLILRGEWIYIGKQYFDLSNNISQDAYSLFNTRVGFSAKNADLMFWMRNISDKKYIAYAYDFGASHLGNPKTLGVTLGVRF